MIDNSIVIRPAVAGDVNPVVAMIRLSMGVEVDWLFGQEKDYPTDIVLSALFLRKGNRLSREVVWVAEQAGRVAGALLAFPGRLLRRLELQTGLHLISIFGFAATVQVVRRQPAYGNLVEAESDEFYLSHLGVFPEYQGRGIGARMLGYVDSLAHTAGLKKCSLIVSFDNPAGSLYERSGYRVVQTYPLDHPFIAHASGGFYRMVKLLKTSS